MPKQGTRCLRCAVPKTMLTNECNKKSVPQHMISNCSMTAIVEVPITIITSIVVNNRVGTTVLKTLTK